MKKNPPILTDLDGAMMDEIEMPLPDVLSCIKHLKEARRDAAPDERSGYPDREPK